MTKSMRQHQSAIRAILLSCALASCDKESEQPNTTTTLPNKSSIPSAQSLPKALNASDSIAKVAERSPSNFKFEKLILTVGTKIPLEMVNQIETEGQSVPALNDQIGKGWKTYALGLQGDGGLIIHMADGYLNVFGYAYKSPEAGGADSAETLFLTKFKLASESKAEVLNATFDTVSIPVKKYVHKTNTTIQAVSYTHGANRTLAFYDATKVDVSKLLPSPPDVVGKDTIEKVKAMLKNSGK